MGTEDVLDKAQQFAISDKAKAAIERLRQINHLLCLYNASDHVTFDLSMSGGYGYYTGIVFRAYTYGTGDAVVRGGRYDHLLEKFGKETPSIGFAIIVDELMNALSRQKISVDTIRRNIIVYNEETESNAIILAGNFREKGRCIELIRQKEGQDKSLYESYAKRKNAAALIYLCDDKSWNDQFDYRRKENGKHCRIIAVSIKGVEYEIFDICPYKRKARRKNDENA